MEALDNDLQRYLLAIRSLVLASTMLLVAFQLGWLALHIWTIRIAYETGGFCAALVTGLLPLFSQVYWLVDIWTADGVFWNLYAIVLACLVLVAALSGMFVFLASWLEKRLSAQPRSVGPP